MNYEELKHELDKLGVTILGTGLGPCYTYKGIDIGGGIDTPTTLEKHWSIKLNGRLGISIYPYRKKYIRSVEMVDGKPVKKFTKEEYKEYDELNNPQEFIEGVKQTISELEKVLPKLNRRLALHTKYLGSLIKSNEYYIQHDIFKKGYNGEWGYNLSSGYFPNDSRYTILSETDKFYLIKIVNDKNNGTIYMVSKVDLSTKLHISVDNYMALLELNMQLNKRLYEGSIV